MELINKTPRNIYEQDILVKMKVSDLVIINSLLMNSNDDSIFEANHYASQTAQSYEYDIYKDLFKAINKDYADVGSELFNETRKLIYEIFNIKGE